MDMAKTININTIEEEWLEYLTTYPTIKEETHKLQYDVMKQSFYAGCLVSFGYFTNTIFTIKDNDMSAKVTNMLGDEIVTYLKSRMMTQ